MEHPGADVQCLGLPPDRAAISGQWWGKGGHDHMKRTIAQGWRDERDYSVTYDQIQGSPEVGQHSGSEWLLRRRSAPK